MTKRKSDDPEAEVSKYTLFFELVAEHFGFLTTEFGMRPAAKRAESILCSRPFKNKQMIISVNIDFRDREMDVWFRPVENVGPGSTPVIGPDCSFNRFRLENLLTAKGAGSDLIDSLVVRLGSNEDMRWMIELQARCVREYGADVLRGDYEVLPAVVQSMEELQRRNIARWEAEKAAKTQH